MYIYIYIYICIIHTCMYTCLSVARETENIYSLATSHIVIVKHLVDV